MKKALILDSTQIESFLTCPEHWNLSSQQQLELPGEIRRPMIMGTYGHKLLEIYYKECATGNSKTAAETALAFNIDEPESRFPLEKPDRELVKRQFTLYTYTYRTCATRFEHSREDIIPDGAEAVEVGFSEKIFEDDFWVYILEGRIDILGILAGQHCFIDHKFQLRSKDIYKKAIQFRNYAMVTKQSLGIINYIRFTKEVTKDTFSRVPISFSKQELDWWRRELLNTFRNVALSIETSGNYFEHRWSSCSGKYGYPCEFTSICEELTPELRQAKKGLYQIKKEWKPW